MRNRIICANNIIPGNNQFAWRTVISKEQIWFMFWSTKIRTGCFEHVDFQSSIIKAKGVFSINFEYYFSVAKFHLVRYSFVIFLSRDEYKKKIIKILYKLINEFNVIIHIDKFKMVKSPLLLKSIVQLNTSNEITISFYY